MATVRQQFLVFVACALGLIPSSSALGAPRAQTASVAPPVAVAPVSTVTVAPVTTVAEPAPASTASTTSTTLDPRSATDRAAGVRSATIPARGSGRLVAVPGTAAAPNPAAARVTVSFHTEEGLDVDGEAFAGFALATLNDPRSWARDGYSFERVPDNGRVRVVLASPKHSEELCGDLVTMGIMSCQRDNRVILTWLRWVQGHEDFQGDVTAYRQYLINHEVGHSLGKGHVNCPGPGQVAPVMMQQTKGLKGCRPGPWPYPAG